MRYLFALALMVIMGLATSFVVTKPVLAVDVFKPCGSVEAKGSDICQAAQCDPTKDPSCHPLIGGQHSVWNRILNFVTYLIGAVSVLMIIIGGFRYTISGGDPSAIKSARDTIIYSAVGLVLASLGNAIVNFVLTNV